MALFVKRLGLYAATIAGILAGGGAAQAQFNPYVMPQFNPLTSTAAAAITSASMPTYGTPYDPSSAYNPYTYGVGPVGGGLMGLADVYRSYGTLLMNMEQARSMREQALQARLDTRRKRFELEMYIKANTPTYVEEQIRIARNTLKRIHGYSTPAEIATGKALNVTFQQIQKYEKGTNRISAGRLQRISEVLNVPVTFFYSGLEGSRDEQRSSDIDFRFLQTDGALRLVRAYARIKQPKVRLQLLRLAETVAGD